MKRKPLLILLSLLLVVLGAVLLLRSGMKPRKDNYSSSIDKQIIQGRLERTNYQMVEWGHWKEIGNLQYNMLLNTRFVDSDHSVSLASVYKKDNTILKIQQRQNIRSDIDVNIEVYFYSNGKIANVYETNVIKSEDLYGKFKVIKVTHYAKSGEKVSFSVDSYNYYTGLKVVFDELSWSQDDYEWRNLDNKGSDACSYGFLNPFFNKNMKSCGCDVDSFFTEKFTIYKSIKQIPQYLKSWFLKVTYSVTNKDGNKIFDMAEPDGEYIAYDVIMNDKYRPIQRLIFAGESKSYAFVYFEHGGFAPYKHLILFKKNDNIPVFYIKTNIEERYDDFTELKKVIQTGRPRDVSPAP